jgi:uncharacterized repeat protein (TIGR01451 family)
MPASPMTASAVPSPSLVPRAARPVRVRMVATLAIAVLGLLATTAAASAETFVVNSTEDAALTNENGTTCVSNAETEGKCTLRAAVQAADNLKGESTITLPAGTYTMAIGSTTSNSARNGDLDVTNGTELTINGAEGASRTIIDAAHFDRAFTVHSGNSLKISGVTVRNGSQGTSFNSESTSPKNGGAFYNDGSLRIEHSILTHNAASSDGGVVFAGAEAIKTSISDSTVTANSAYSEGGVVYAYSGDVDLVRDSISHNTAESDGGVVAAAEGGRLEGEVEVIESNLSYNTSDSDGGALYLEETGPVTISHSELDGNSNDSDSGGAMYADRTGAIAIESTEFYGNTAGSSDGGAIYTDAADISVSESSFYANHAGEGGALYLEGTEAAAVQSITGSTFSENAATDSEGGAIYMDKGALEVSGSTFTTNKASDEGGAIYYSSGDPMSLVNDTFDSNDAGYEGGALYLDESASIGQIELLNDTIARNTAYFGGGIYDPQYATYIQNTIVADNSASRGNGSGGGGGDCYGGRESENALVADAGGNIDSDGTCFGERSDPGVEPLLGPLSNNGGPTKTDALRQGSPAIGLGVESQYDCPATDQRNVTRNRGVHCDAGAYQVEPADISVAVEGPSTANVGEPITYTLVVKDYGPAPATGVAVTDTLPAGTTYFSSEILEDESGSGESENACSGTTTVTCSLGTVKESEGQVIRIVAIPQGAGAIEDTAHVSAQEQDLENENNSSTEATTVSSGVERVETTKTVEVTKTVNSVQTVYVPTGVSGATGTTEKQCKSARSETISWKVPGGVQLSRVVIARNGKLYRVLSGSARKSTVSMVGLPKGAVPVKITGYTASGQRYAMTRTFHLCVPAKEGGGPSSDYLTKV